MDGGGKRIGVVGVDVCTPYRSPLADCFSLVSRQIEPRNTHGIGAILVPLKARQRGRSTYVPELGLFVRCGRGRELDFRRVKSRSEVMAWEMRDTCKQRLREHGNGRLVYVRCVGRTRSLPGAGVVMMMVVMVVHGDWRRCDGPILCRSSGSSKGIERTKGRGDGLHGERRCHVIVCLVVVMVMVTDKVQHVCLYEDGRWKIHLLMTVLVPVLE